MSQSEKRLFFLLLALSFLGLILRLLFLWKYSTAFTYDQGRDLLDLREMMIDKKLRLIGPNTSLHGVFYGPFWYWAALPIYFLTGGHPFSTLIPLLVLSLLMPIIFFLLVEDKRLGFILASIYLFAYSFFTHSIVALNTNPMIFLMPLLVLFLAQFYKKEKGIFLWLALFLMAVFFHFEPLIGIFGLPIFLIATIFLKKISLVFRKKRAFLAFLIPFVPQIIFELRHQFLQTKTVLTLFSGGGSSLTPASGNLSYRFFDRLKVFEDIFFSQSGRTWLLASLFLIFIVFLIFKIFSTKNKFPEIRYLAIMTLISLILVFLGFVIYPYALWPWYLSTVDALILTLIGLGIYFFSRLGRRYTLLAAIILLIFLFVNIAKYQIWPPNQASSPDPANLRNRLAVINLIYNDGQNRGMKIFTFAPYVYDYPYQYLIWWRAKEKYGYLPEKYYYLPDQPKYVAAKEEADRLIPSKKSECDYLIIEPYESQEKWFWEWRGHFPKSQKTWTVGLTRVEKLCQ